PCQQKTGSRRRRLRASDSATSRLSVGYATRGRNVRRNPRRSRRCTKPVDCPSLENGPSRLTHSIQKSRQGAADVIFSMIMVPKLSEEQRQLIESMQGRPIEVCDDRTQRIYVLVDRDEFRQLTDNHFRRELQVGFDQA